MKRNVKILIDKVRSELELSNLSSEEFLVLAVSGGVDSLVLLHLFAVQGLHPGDKIIVGHLDHCLRASSAVEAEKVRETAGLWGVPCFTGQVDVVGMARDEGLSLEEAGRKARYHFLAEVAEKAGAMTLVTGHNGDDQVETVLMHLIRGSGLNGLQGMLQFSNVPGHPDLKLFRPLLYISRQEIETYALEYRLEPNIDASNRDVTYLRNRVRHQLLPHLEDYNPNIKVSIGQLANIVAADNQFLTAETQQAWSAIVLAKERDWIRLDRQAWLDLPLALRRSTLRQSIEALHGALVDLGFRSLELVRNVAETGHVGQSVAMPAGVRLVVGYDDLMISYRGARPGRPNVPQLPGIAPLKLKIPGSLNLAKGWTISASICNLVAFEDIVANQDPWQAFVDLGQTTELTVRIRMPGDRMSPLGMNGQSKKIKDMMIDAKIPDACRQNWPIITSGDHIVWLVGFHIDNRFMLTKEIDRIFHLQATKPIR